MARSAFIASISFWLTPEIAGSTNGSVKIFITAAIPFAAISCWSSPKYPILAVSTCVSYVSIHAFVVRLKPASSSPCSTFTTKRLLTSPEPVPPLMVLLAPLPKRAIVLTDLSIGSAPLFSNNTIPWDATFLARSMFLFSRELISEFPVANNFDIVWRSFL